jgi:hypothetical protein
LRRIKVRKLLNKYFFLPTNKNTNYFTEIRLV